MPVKAVGVQDAQEHVRPLGVFHVDARRLLDARGHHEADAGAVGHRAKHRFNGSVLQLQGDGLRGQGLFLSLQRRVRLPQEDARLGRQVLRRRGEALAVNGLLLPVFGKGVGNVLRIARRAAREKERSGGRRERRLKNRFRKKLNHGIGSLLYF